MGNRREGSVLKGRKARAGGGAFAVLLAAAAVGSGTAAGPQLAQASTNSGGTMTVTWSANPQTIDPRKIYNGEDWNIGRALYVGLYDDDSHFQLKPAVAAGPPKISNGGRVYTIQLRKDVKWSNGKPVTAQDFVYALRTELDPKFQSPDSYLWYMLKGASDYEAGKSKYLGIEAIGKYTLRYTLSQPFSAFPYVLSVPASFPVYSGSGNDVNSRPVTNGPYVVDSWQRGVRMILRKNPYYNQPGKPYPDRLEFDFNVDPSVGIMRVQSGQADLVGDGIPSANYLQLAGNPRYSQDITRGFMPAIVLLALNERVKPFNDPLVRKAVQYAINKRHLLQLLNGRGELSHGVLPPSLPGMKGDIPDPYPYNPAKARALLKQAGYPHGFTTQLGLASEQTGSSEIATEVQADLQAIGVKVTVKPLPQEASAMAEVPMMTYSWYMDYPDPSDFIDGFVASPAVVGGSNPAFLNDQRIRKLAVQADGMPLGTARSRLYKQIDKLAMQDAAYVPLFCPELTYFHSDRVQAFDRPAVYFPAIYSDLWLK
ncbi:MAG: ABC transporter substrate-binding protein [Alicyclobacillus sp.]|nr:ABC transporter substrate-binding protein [Alicyclobacillus sp.]